MRTALLLKMEVTWQHSIMCNTITIYISWGMFSHSIDLGVLIYEGKSDINLNYFLQMNIIIIFFNPFK
jgi:hypothetical protein